MSRPNRKLRVGVTLHVRDGQQSIWENGIFQNCAFLVQLLARSPAVERAVLVNGSGVKVASEGMMLQHAGVEMISLDEAMHQLDIVIEMSALLSEEWVSEYKRRGGKFVWMRVGNDYVIDIERAIFDKPPGALCSSKSYDAVWTIPEYKHSCTDYFAITARAPVRIVPHLWTPLFFQKGIDALPNGIQFGYKTGRAQWRVCCFEPNICMVKTSVIPMLVCEEAYRAKPGALESVRLCNTFHLKEHSTFVELAKRLDIVNHGLASFEGRYAIYEYMAHYGDCIVSHHWENGQNYLYYEALYGGYPLIHNSEFIRDYGYYYPGFDCAEGGRALMAAHATHDQNLREYQDKARELLSELDINNPRNVAVYTTELERLYAT